VVKSFFVMTTTAIL